MTTTRTTVETGRNQPLTLNQPLDAETAEQLWPQHEFSQPCVQVLWAAALQNHYPLRSRAAEFGLKLPEPPVSLWERRWTRCFCCNEVKRLLHIHHIERRAKCYKPRRDWIENLAALCVRCHDGVMGIQPHAQQLALKWKADKCGWATLQEFLTRWLSIGDRVLKAPNRVTVEEVEAYL